MDKNNLYCEGSKVEIELNTQNARFLSRNILLDDEHVYLGVTGCPLSGKIEVSKDLEGQPIILDGKTVREIAGDIVKDDTNIYRYVNRGGGEHGWMKVLNEISYEDFISSL